MSMNFFDNWFFRDVFKVVMWNYKQTRLRLPNIPFLSDFVLLPDGDLQMGEEQAPPFEEEYIERMLELFERRHLRSYPQGVRPMLRDFHPKGHGCVEATFRVLPDLPAEYRYGVFAEPKSHDAVIRYSNGIRDGGPDNLPSPRGMAIKLRQQGKDIGQDFVLADYAVNLVANVEEAFYFYRAEAANKPESYLIRHWRSFAIGVLSTVRDIPDLFDCTYYSQTPYRLGPRQACKYIAIPRQPSGNKTVPSRTDYLRDQMVKRLTWDAPEVVFDFCVQRQMHPVRQPVENASYEWDAVESIPVKVATITLKKLNVDCPFSSPEQLWDCEGWTFSPANAWPEHTPMGGLNRLRKRAYEATVRRRQIANARMAPEVKP